MHAIETQSLTKIYRSGIQAVDDVTLSVDEGEIFGFLGPNGAGKSTFIMLLTTLLRITSGTALVAGQDVDKHPQRVRRAIGYVSQDLAVDDNLTGWENMFLQAKFYGLNAGQLKERIPEVLGMVNLAERVHDLVETYSGGMRKRLDIAEGLIHRPKILFLDEPTLGLDIQTRSEIWNYVKGLRDRAGMTIFLTTHYMEEADRLCDRIAIIDRGKIRAIDTPARLKQDMGGDLITFALAGTEESIRNALSAIASLPNVRSLQPAGQEFAAVVENGESLVPEFFNAIRSIRAQITSITLKQPTLDDVYLHFTGKGLRDEQEGGKEEAMRRRLVMRRARQ